MIDDSHSKNKGDSLNLKSQKIPLYTPPLLIKLDTDSTDIASGGPNPGPDGTFGNNS